MTLRPNHSGVKRSLSGDNINILLVKFMVVRIVKLGLDRYASSDHNVSLLSSSIKKLYKGNQDRLTENKTEKKTFSEAGKRKHEKSIFITTVTGKKNEKKTEKKRKKTRKI